MVELEPLGHRLRYVRLLLEGLPPTERLLLVSPQVAASPEFREHLADAEVIELGSDDHDTAIPEALVTATEHGAGHLVIPDGDKAVRPLLRTLLRGSLSLARPRRPRITLLLMRTATPGGPEAATVGMALKPALVAALRRLPAIRVLFLTDAFGVVTRRPGFPGVRPVRDPVTPVAELPGGHRSGRTRIGALGVISARKNVPVLVRAAARRDDVDVVLAGRCEPDVRAFLDTDPDAERLRTEHRLHVDDRLLDEDEFDAALRSVDVAAVLHDNDAPSGIVAEACARGVPVLGPDRGWIATVLDATGCGVGARVDDPEDVVKAITRLLADRERYVVSAQKAAGVLGVDDFVTGLLDDRA
ncbi:glycosyl transferase family 1 [Actinomycetospora succinea]|uniref:Glycosyl transferase family 1 n=1 Tax=Actinomycetospora succinea TaxID=663603 RepID=A0A4R6UU35_9PSEU|nr:glycosyltransferase [Actinomycetospora succinea]TDQ48885.1 glycosyl transferase family 1 [Actinomycetospora succinea]